MDAYKSFFDVRINSYEVNKNAVCNETHTDFVIFCFYCLCFIIIPFIGWADCKFKTYNYRWSPCAVLVLKNRCQLYHNLQAFPFSTHTVSILFWIHCIHMYCLLRMSQFIRLKFSIKIGARSPIGDFNNNIMNTQRANAQHLSIQYM